MQIGSNQKVAENQINTWIEKGFMLKVKHKTGHTLYPVIIYNPKIFKNTQPKNVIHFLLKNEFITKAVIYSMQDNPTHMKNRLKREIKILQQKQRTFYINTIY